MHGFVERSDCQIVAVCDVNRDRLQSAQQYFWCYGGGDTTNCGVHQLDLACMVLGLQTHSRSVYTAGRPRED